VKDFSAIAACLLLWALTMWVSYMEGRAAVMTNTVVEVGTPYYDGVFFGKCKQIGVVQACATDEPPEKKP
jgi:hypothetical protein